MNIGDHLTDVAASTPAVLQSTPEVPVAGAAGLGMAIVTASVMGARRIRKRKE